MPTQFLCIKGKVQGVFYRATAREKAVELGLTGWVKNTEEGNVEALVTGPTGRLEEFVAWCRQGPPRSVVTAVEVQEKEEVAFENFRIIRD